MRYWWMILALIAASGPLCGQETKKTVIYRLSAAEAPSPALRYVLLPQIGDLQPGNAAYWYQRAHSPDSIAHILRHPDYPKIGDWLALPLAKFPRKKAETFRMSFLDEIDLAARHQQCDWQLVQRLKKDGFMILLPDLSTFRQFARLVANRARLEILDGDYEKAVRSIQTGMQLARHIAEGPSLIHGLVGLAAAHVTLDRVEDLIQQRDAPNLYWALSQLPRPFIDMRIAFEAERMIGDSVLPGIRKSIEYPAEPPMSNQRLQKIIDDMSTIYGLIGGNMPGGHKALNRFLVAVTAAKMYPNAKKFLAARGFTKSQIAQVPVVQAAFMTTLIAYDRAFDEFAKWVHLPFHQALPGVKIAALKMRKRISRFSGNSLIPFVEAIVPAFENVLVGRMNLDRRIATLQHVEALRLYAHQKGRFPSTLAKLQPETPLLPDPATGQSFNYKLNSPTKAVLMHMPPAGVAPTHRNSARYELELYKKNDK